MGRGSPRLRCRACRARGSRDRHERPLSWPPALGWAIRGQRPVRGGRMRARERRRPPRGCRLCRGHRRPVRHDAVRGPVRPPRTAVAMFLAAIADISERVRVVALAMRYLWRTHRRERSHIALSDWSRRSTGAKSGRVGIVHRNGWSSSVERRRRRLTTEAGCDNWVRCVVAPHLCHPN